MKKKRCLLLASLLVQILSGCTSNPDYQLLVERGLNSGVQNDSLFLGYYFGMVKEEFWSHSWEMNQKVMMTGFVDIEYPFHELKSEALMKFYLEFQDNKIVRIPVAINYKSWAPWNEEYWPENLAKDLTEYYEETYSTRFHEVFIPEIEKTALVSVEGNREIRIYRISETSVMVDFRNLHILNPFHDPEVK